MSEKPKSTQARARKRERQGQDLGRKGVALGTLAAQQNKEEFFEQIVPLLQLLESYIERRLRIDYLTMQIRTPLYISGDILDEVVLNAYSNYGEKPQTLSLEEWLNQIAN